MRNQRIVEVDWIDTRSDDEWLTRKEAIAWTEKTEKYPIRSVGYIIDKKKYIILISGYDTLDDNCERIIKIPKVNVIKIKELKYE